MSVYVDDMRAAFGRLIMCHMIADTPEELRAMARQIGVAEKWIQHPGTRREHFDVCLSKRAEAVRLGAKEISQREMGMMWRARRLASECFSTEAAARAAQGAPGGAGQ